MKEVFYRQFRPNQFSKVVGQDAAMAILKSNCSSDSWHHAYMFAGHSGSGKTTSARILAAVVNCENRSPGSHEACWNCSSCISIKEGAAIDCREIDGGSNGGKEEIKKVIESSLFSPSVMKKRVFIIDEAHQLTSAAWSSLLKPTEEPGSHVIYIFCTSEPGKIPDTIASRLRRVYFRPVRSSVIADYLFKLSNHLRNNLKRNIPECSMEACLQIAEAADGNLRDALNYLESLFLVANSDTAITVDHARAFLGLVGRDSLYEIVDAIADGNSGKALDITISLEETGPDLVLMMKELGTVLRKLMLFCNGANSGAVAATDDERKMLTAISAKVDRRKSKLYCGIFCDALRAFDVKMERRWVLETLVARLSDPETKQS